MQTWKKFYDPELGLFLDLFFFQFFKISDIIIKKKINLGRFLRMTAMMVNELMFSHYRKPGSWHFPFQN